MINKNNLKIESKRIYLRLLHPNDASREYLNWLKDLKVTRFMECRYYRYSFKELMTYIRNMHRSNNNFLFGIFLKDNREHIGNVKIGNINVLHRFADLGIMIGKKECWGKGYGSEAIKLITMFAFNKLRLHKLFAGIYANNKGSYKAFLKCGYSDAGRLRKHRKFNKTYVDEIIVEKINR